MEGIDDVLNEIEKVALGLPRFSAAGKQRVAELGMRGGEALVGGLALGTAGAAVGAVGLAAREIYNAATKSRDFRAMLEAHPHLEHADPRQLNQAFTTLRRFAPEFSRDPYVAGSYVDRLVANPAAAGTLLEGAIGAIGRMPRSPIQEFAGVGVAAGHQLAVSGQQHSHRLDQMAREQAFSSGEANKDRAFQATKSNIEQQKRRDLGFDLEELKNEFQLQREDREEARNAGRPPRRDPTGGHGSGNGAPSTHGWP